MRRSVCFGASKSKLQTGSGCSGQRASNEHLLMAVLCAPMQPRQQQPGQPHPPVGRLLRGGPRQLPTLQPPGRADGRPLAVLHARRVAAVLRLRQNRARFPHRAAREGLRGKAHHRSVTRLG